MAKFFWALLFAFFTVVIATQVLAQGRTLPEISAAEGLGFAKPTTKCEELIPSLKIYRDSLNSNTRVITSFIESSYQVTNHWFIDLSNYQNQKIRFPVQKFSPLQSSSTSIEHLAEQIFELASNDDEYITAMLKLAKTCGFPEDTMSNMDSALTEFSLKNYEHLSTTADYLKHVGEQVGQWHREWKNWEDQLIDISLDQFEVISETAAGLEEATMLVKANAQVVLNELERSMPHGRSPNN